MLISFRIDWFDLLAVQGTLKSLLQHYLKASFLQFLVFYMVQLSILYMTTGKTTAMNMLTYVGKMMSLLFNSLLRFVITFLSRNNRHVIWWLQAPSAVILESKKLSLPLFPFFSPSMFSFYNTSWKSRNCIFKNSCHYSPRLHFANERNWSKSGGNTKQQKQVLFSWLWLAITKASETRSF